MDKEADLLGRELKREINELHIEYTQALGRKHSAAKAEEYVRLAVLPECDHVAWMLGMASALPGFALADLLRWPRKRRETKIREYLNYVTNLDVDTIRKKIKRYQKSIVIPKPSPVALDWIRECLARHSFKSRQ